VASERDAERAAATERRRVERRTREAEERVAALESELAQLEVALADGSLYTGVTGALRADELVARRETLQRALSDAMVAWEAAVSD
jgi:hypothetical protein